MVSWVEVSAQISQNTAPYGQAVIFFRARQQPRQRPDIRLQPAPVGFFRRQRQVLASANIRETGEDFGFFHGKTAPAIPPTMRQKELFFPLTKISPLKPRLLYDNSIATDEPFPAHFQKPPQPSTHPAMRLRMFVESGNN